MRKELELIKQIDQYREGTLGEAEKVQFEANLSYDSQLQEEVALQQEIIGGVERHALKSEIKQGLQNYKRVRNLQRYAAVGLGLIVAGTTAVYMNSSDPINSETRQQIVVASDVATEQGSRAGYTAPKVVEATELQEKKIAPQKSAMPTESKEAVSGNAETNVILNTPSTVISSSPDIPETVSSGMGEAVSSGTTAEAIQNLNLSKETDAAKAQADEYTIKVAKGQRTVESTKVVEHIQIPVATAFSPNGDGINDVWKITAEGIVELQCTIYTPQGEKVYEFKGVDDTWDGKTGVVRTENTYVYHLRVKYSGSNTFAPVQIGTIKVLN